ncbi:hypothetical protein [Lysobacter gummosus]|uniref:hypothetical protein n=1 Tax=Lysobacter gummosus TaxID=262324 RepID=UPI00363B54AA
MITAPVLPIGIAIIVFGANSILTGRAMFDWSFGGGDNDSSEGEEVFGWKAVLVGALTIALGVVLIVHLIL